MNEQERQAVANFRYGLIAPLVSRKLGAGHLMALMRDIVSHVYETPAGQEKRISLRTLERYVQSYRTGGWDALVPSPRADKLGAREIPDDVLGKAIALKQEQPGRSVRQIIAILELATFVAPGVLKESTLSKQLRRRGITRKALMNSGWSQFRRFEATHRNAYGRAMSSMRFICLIRTSPARRRWHIWSFSLTIIRVIAYMASSISRNGSRGLKIV